jgi:hypothetical protein
MGEKCCTKKEKCDNTPTCSKKMTFSQILVMVLGLNFFIVLFRCMLIKRGELGSGPGLLWGYLSFIFFLELQLFGVVLLYQITVSTYFTLIKTLKLLIESIRRFLSPTARSKFANWLGLGKPYWWVRKIISFIAILWYAFCFFVVLGAYILFAVLFGPFFLGYYSINATTRR